MNGTVNGSVLDDQNGKEEDLSHILDLDTAPLILLSAISILSMILNMTVIISILFRRSARKKATNVFVTSLCFTQLLVATVVLPTFCWPQIFAIHEHFSALVIMSYVSNLCAITYERYVAVKHGLRYYELMRYSFAVKVVLACWLVSVILQAIPASWANISYAQFIHRIYLVLILLAFLVFPLMYLVFAYATIYIETVALLKREKHFGLSKSSELLHNVRDKSENEMVTFKLKSSNDNLSEDDEGQLNKDLNQSATLRCSENRLSVNSRIGFHSRRTDERHSMSLADSRNSSQKSNACVVTASPSLNYKSSLCQTSLHRRSSPLPIRTPKLPNMDSVRYREAAKVTAVFATVTLTYLVTWIPVMYMTCLEIAGKMHMQPNTLKIASAFTIGINSIIDPVLYGVCLKDIRKRVISMCKFYKRNK